MSAITIMEDKTPTKLYQTMRVACGLSAKTDEACDIGLNNSLYSVMVKEGGNIIGMGRVIGDGGCFCQVVDICVIPEKQGKGIGRIIMENIANFINAKLPSSCYISLIADGNASHLYEKFGFKDTFPASKGMFLKKS